MNAKSQPKNGAAQSAPKQQTSELFDRQPPRNLQAERAVLGSILLLPDVCDDVALVLRPEDFYDDANQRLYANLLAMHNDGQRVDSMLLVDRLQASGEFELIGGLAYIAELFNDTPTASFATHYAEIVHAKAVLRALITASSDILRDAYDPTADSRAMLGRAEEKIFAILDDKSSGQVSEIGAILKNSLDRIDARMKDNHAIGGIETGFADFDSLTGGLHDSELIILAARPSMGKTALAMNIAEHAVLNSKPTPTLFVSLEMSALELGDRLLCSRARINGRHLRSGTIGSDDINKLIETAAEISQAKLFVEDTPSRTMTEIAATARRLKRKENLGLVIIDYLQLIEPDNPRDPRQEQVAKIARRLKGLARELKIPVMCLAQLNRQAEQSKENKPRLSHLRESGAIEQDADVVMFVHREEYYANNEEDRARTAGAAEIIIAKQRNGPIGQVKLVFRSDFTRFENCAYEPYDFSPGAPEPHEPKNRLW